MTATVIGYSQRSGRYYEIGIKCLSIAVLTAKRPNS